MSTLRKLLLITLLVLFLSPVASYAKTDEASMLEQARKHYQAKNYSFAYTWLERVLREYPATSRREEVLLMLSKAYASTGRDDKAAETLHTLLKEYPKAGQTLDPDLAKLAGGPEVVATEVKAAEAKAAKAMAEMAKSAAEKAAAAKAAEAAAAKAAEAATAKAAEAATEEKVAAAKAAVAKASEAKGAEEKAAEAALQPARVEAFLRKLAAEKTARMAAAERVAKAEQTETVAAEAPAAGEKAAEVKDPGAAAKEAMVKEAMVKEAMVKAAKVKAAERKAAEARADEAKAALVLAAEAKEAERREAEARIAEQKVAEEVIAELKISEQRNAEERAAEGAAEKAAAQRAAELKAAELKAAELEAGAALQPLPAKVLSSAAVVGLPLLLAAPGIPADLPAPARDAGASAVLVPVVAPAGSLAENVRWAGNPGSSAKAVTYTLLIGEYAAPQAMEEAKRKIKKAGLEPVVEQGAKRKGPMIRLSAGDFPTLEAAKKQLNKLREAKVDGFFLLGGDKRYHVYVGSYSDEKSAAEEGARLAALGIKPSMKRVVVPVPTFKLTAGSFPTRVAALAMAEELEKQGVHSVPVECALPEKLP